MDKEKNSTQRLKILYLYRVLLEQTDKQHTLSMPEIIEQLAKYGITAERRAIYDDIEALRVFGADIQAVKGRTWGYYLASRDFELAELKLLADAISSSRFLTARKSSALIKKISRLASVHEARQIQRQLFISNRVKSMNESIYSNVDVINRAIDEKRQISFKYFRYDTRKEKDYRIGTRTCHPYALVWENENYYLIAFNDNHNDISNFRVDRMENVTVLDTAIKPKPKDFDLAKYVSSTFSMFSGDVQSVKLRIKSGLVNIFIDRFGKDVHVSPESKEYFTVSVNVKPTTTFFGWLFQLDDEVEIISPKDVKDKYIAQLERVLKAANKKEEKK